MDEAEYLAGQMALHAACPDDQVSQTRLRLELVRGWAIPEGARVLEVGCGQGDMTAALALAVGPSGRVTAVDVADPDYGGPVTVGRSSEHLSRTFLGPRIDFRYGFDLLDEAHDFAADSFDYAVFAHCSWYFGSLETVRRSLARVRPWALRLCYSEWDLEPRSIDQAAHLLAVLIQGQVEAFREDGGANVRTPSSRSTLEGLLAETGWALASASAVDSGGLADGRWEIEICLEDALGEAEGLDLPPKVLDLLGSQLDVLARLAERCGRRSLPSYSLVAERSPGWSGPA